MIRRQRFQASVRPRVFILFLFGVFFLYFLYTICVHIFKIRTIEFIGDNVRVSADAWKETDNLLLLQTHKLEYSLKTEYPQLFDVIVTKRFPSTIRISVRIREPVMRVVSDTVDVLVDDHGLVLADTATRPSTVPVIRHAISAVSYGKMIQDPFITYSLNVFRALRGTLPITELIDGPNESLCIVSGETNIFIAQQADLIYITSTLQTLLPRFRMKGIMPTTIDLRFNKPIISME